MTKGTVLVASPSAIGNRPEASGSSVPACPARFPGTGVSPRSPHGSSSCLPVCRARPSRARRASRAWASAAGSASQRRALSTVVIRLVVEVALDRGRSQQLLDSLGFIEALVESEPDVGGKFQVDAPRNLAA